MEYAIPTKFIVKPYGTILTVMGDTTTDYAGNEVVEYKKYIQVGLDSIQWLELGEFLVLALDKKLNSEPFKHELLALYKTHVCDAK